VVDGRPFNLREGRVLLTFSTRNVCTAWAWHGKWRNAIGAPHAWWSSLRAAAFRGGLPGNAGLRAGISLDAALLRNAFPFTDPPYASPWIAASRRHVQLGTNGENDYYERLRDSVT
jgi:hypothetical protein